MAKKSSKKLALGDSPNSKAYSPKKNPIIDFSDLKGVTINLHTNSKTPKKKSSKKVVPLSFSR